MLHEHAITYRGALSIGDLDYIVKKANKSGLIGKEVVRIYEELDSEGTHVYFDIQGQYEQRRAV